VAAIMGMQHGSQPFPFLARRAEIGWVRVLVGDDAIPVRTAPAQLLSDVDPTAAL